MQCNAAPAGAHLLLARTYGPSCVRACMPPRSLPVEYSALTVYKWRESCRTEPRMVGAGSLVYIHSRVSDRATGMLTSSWWFYILLLLLCQFSVHGSSRHYKINIHIFKLCMRAVLCINIRADEVLHWKRDVRRNTVAVDFERRVQNPYGRRDEM
jgi:hypothetical protein